MKLHGTEPGIPDETDRAIVKEFIILPIVLTVLDHDKTIFSRIGVKYPELYSGILERVMDVVTRDLSEVRKEMRRRGIKAYLDSRDNMSIRHMYTYRGYSDQLNLLWSYVKAEVEARLTEYLGLSQ